jgi:hypothetical protein
MMRTKLRTEMKSLMISFFTILLCSSAIAQVDPVGKDRVAIGGYDVVSYFKGTPWKGNPLFQAVHKTVVYYFISEQNKNAFSAEPDKYLPQYDGWCALAIGAQKKKVKINPETFKITNGKLYLFYNTQSALSGTKFNSLEPWIKDEENLIKKSDINWVGMKGKKN